VIRTIDLRGDAPAEHPDYRAHPRAGLPRVSFDVEAALLVVAPICADVRRRGLAAVAAATRRFDGVEQETLRVPAEAISGAVATVDVDVRAALEEAIRRLRRSCEAERDTDVTTRLHPGGTVTRRSVAIRRVGLYVPGGLAPLVSSVVMNVVPAQVAGVDEIALTSSPQREHHGLPHPTILAACGLLGVSEVYAVGGAQAIAMFGYGAGECHPVDLITGPGNVYVAAAKRLMASHVGVDAEAGPTEIAILADDSADASHVAVDLISQSEHDPAAASLLVTDSISLVRQVGTELDRQVAATKHAERIRASLSGPQSAIVLVDDLEHGLALVDAYAAEHLSIQTRRAPELAERVRSAGAVFVGPFSPVSLGDYCAGSNHVLPTAGCARYASGLSVRTFRREMQVVSYDEAALRQVAHHVVALAEAEDLPAHAAAVLERL